MERSNNLDIIRLRAVEDDMKESLRSYPQGVPQSGPASPLGITPPESGQGVVEETE